jgi:cullin 3
VPLYISAKRYQLVVNVYQACVLCLFNTQDEYSFDELKQLTQIQDTELNQGMSSLCNPKIKVLLKANMKSPKFEPTEKAKINLAFANQNVKVNMIPV